MRKYPLIGVSGSVDVDESRFFILRPYFEALTAAGGVPLLLPPLLSGDALEECLNALDGLLMAGGNDVSPMMYGAKPLPGLGEVNPLRDQFEMRLIRRAVEKRLPVLGICRGIQAINVALGGTLVQDLPAWRQAVPPPMLHSQTSPGRYPSHYAIIENGSKLREILGVESLSVNSFHHQAIDRCAPTLRVTARAEDGVIEAVEYPDLPFFIAVQWHPERMYINDAHEAALFDALTAAARQKGNDAPPAAIK